MGIITNVEKRPENYLVATEKVRNFWLQIFGTNEAPL
jgi:hypothetical protein